MIPLYSNLTFLDVSGTRARPVAKVIISRFDLLAFLFAYCGPSSHPHTHTRFLSHLSPSLCSLPSPKLCEYIAIHVRKYDTLKSLLIANAGLDSAALSTLCKALLGTSSLRKLDVRSNMVGDYGAEALAERKCNWCCLFVCLFVCLFW